MRRKKRTITPRAIIALLQQPPHRQTHIQLASIVFQISNTIIRSPTIAHV